MKGIHCLEVMFEGRSVYVTDWAKAGIAIIDPSRQKGCSESMVSSWVLTQGGEIEQDPAVAESAIPESQEHIDIALRAFAAYLDPSLYIMEGGEILERQLAGDLARYKHAAMTAGRELDWAGLMKAPDEGELYSWDEEGHEDSYEPEEPEWSGSRDDLYDDTEDGRDTGRPASAWVNCTGPAPGLEGE